MEKAKVSVIITAYNREKLIPRAIQSTLNQTYKNLEILIIDDGSIDNTKKIVEEFIKKDHRIKYFYKENGGFSSAANLGIKMSTGEYISFLDSDDEWLPGKVEKSICAFNSNANIGIVACEMIMVKDEEEKIMNFKEKENYGVKNFIKNSDCLIPSVLTIRKTSLGDTLFDENIRISCDTDFIIACLLKMQIFLIKKPLVRYYVHGSNNSIFIEPKKQIVLAKEYEQILEKHSSFFNEDKKTKSIMLRKTGDYYLSGENKKMGLRLYLESIILDPTIKKSLRYIRINLPDFIIEKLRKLKNMNILR